MSKTVNMNSIERELHGFIGQAEAMSGFDSYDSNEGDMSYFDDMDSFDGDSFDYDADPMSYASGQQAQAVSDPYVIQYDNPTGATVTGVLFGYNDNFNVVNYGNAPTTIVTNLQGGSYSRLLSQSNNKFFKVGKWRFQSASSSQLSQTLTLTHYDANGKQYSTPLNLSIMRDAYQFQNDILDVTKPVTVDGNTQITFPLLANTVFVISIFPVSVISGKAVLNGGTSLNTAKAPRLSGKNVAPVIIQTTQGVAGISKS